MRYFSTSRNNSFTASRNYSTNNYRQRMPGLICSDYVKLIVFGFISLLCIYTYFDKYFQINMFTQADGGARQPLPSTLKVKLDDAICNRFKGDVQIECQQEFVQAAKEVAKSCDAYYQRLRNCNGGCEMDKNNLDSCIVAVARKTSQKWDTTLPNQ
jgi:hypothetical protein